MHCIPAECNAKYCVPRGVHYDLSILTIQSTCHKLRSRFFLRFGNFHRRKQKPTCKTVGLPPTILRLCTLGVTLGFSLGSSDLTLEPGTRLLESGYPDSILVNK